MIINDTAGYIIWLYRFIPNLIFYLALFHGMPRLGSWRESTNPSPRGRTRTTQLKVVQSSAACWSNQKKTNGAPETFFEAAGSKA